MTGVRRTDTDGVGTNTVAKFGSGADPAPRSDRPRLLHESVDEGAVVVLDEPAPPSLGRYTHEHTRRWAEKIRSFDAYVFVTPEYNHSTSGALKNAIDYLFQEWNNKAAGFVSYGSAGGARAVEHLRLILAELMVATVRAQVMLSLYTDFQNFTTFTPDARHAQGVQRMLDQVVSWGEAMSTVRSTTPQ